MYVESRNLRKQLNGVVVGLSGSKTFKMVYFYTVPHPQYGKEIKRKTTVHVHDEKNEVSVGDQVSVSATRPLSKLKRWRLVKILKKTV